MSGLMGGAPYSPVSTRPAQLAVGWVRGLGHCGPWEAASESLEFSR